MNRHFLETKLGQIHYIDMGPRQGKPILMLHKSPHSTDEYADILPILAPKYRAIAMDTLGYGDSDKPSKQPSVDDYVYTIRLLIETLGLNKVNVVGHLSGSIYAIELSASSSELVNKLIVSSPIWMDETTRENRPALFPQWKVKSDGSHLIDMWNDRMPKVSNNAYLCQRLLVDTVKSGEISEWAHYANARYHMEERWPLVKCPTLVIIGMKDPYVDPQKVRMFKQVRPETRELFWTDGSYFLPDETPETFARIVEDFIEGRKIPDRI